MDLLNMISQLESACDVMCDEFASDPVGEEEWPWFPERESWDSVLNNPRTSCEAMYSTTTVEEDVDGEHGFTGCAWRNGEFAR